MYHISTTYKHTFQQNLTVIGSAATSILPISIAVIPWGILCGSLAIQSGLTPLQAQLMSLFVFAGAAQLASLSLMNIASPLLSIYSSTFVISARHLLYSAVFEKHVRELSLFKRLCLAFFLTDEMFAISCAYIEKHKHFSYLYSLTAGVTFYLAWNLSTLIGLSFGQYFGDLDKLGLDFAIAATFIAIVVPTIKDKATLYSVVVSAVTAVILHHMGVSQGLIIATAFGMTVGYLTTTNGTQS
ncbi:AzlC family ABC transporter permease [Vibrio profundum]|uniref:AzlC family ABC transporter permease n=1 Tax=Vibrio profundum TaxID=2910247 RepID=UPI003D1505FB